MRENGSGAGPAAPDDAPAATRALGVVELREDVPLKGRGGAARLCAGGPRLIPAAFGALSACVTVALLTQVYCGDYELVPHGSVASAAAACSRAGTDALKAGGLALDAAATAAICLAVLAPHRTSLDASGSLLYWEYRELRTQQPVLYEWGDTGPEQAGAGPDARRPPRLLAALAHLHAALGALPWEKVLAPAVQLARDGFTVSEGLSLAEAARGVVRPAGSNATAPNLARFLLSLQMNTSSELAQAWNSAQQVRSSMPARAQAGAWRALAGGRGAGAALRALRAALEPPPASPDDAHYRVVAALQREAGAGGALDAGGVASGLAVVDSRGTYLALVTGISEPFGSGEMDAAGWQRDEPTVPIDLAPAILFESNVCGSRYVLGAESAAALAQAGAALAAEGAMSAVERARVALGAGGALAQEAPPERNASRAPAAVNLVLQRGDALSSHADSRGGGLASRF